MDGLGLRLMEDVRNLVVEVLVARAEKNVLGNLNTFWGWLVAVDPLMWLT